MIPTAGGRDVDLDVAVEDEPEAAVADLRVAEDVLESIQQRGGGAAKDTDFRVFWHGSGMRREA
jgi:hypothetical protein